MKKILPLIIFLVVTSFLYVGLSLNAQKLPSPLIGKVFPNIEVEDFTTKKKYFIKDRFKNSTVLINVWASWCVTCRAEHEILNKIAKTKNNIQLVGINYKDTKKDANEFLNILGNPFDFIVFDNLGKLSIELGVYATPETFLVDKNGIIKFKQIGQITPKIWQEEILPLVL